MELANDFEVSDTKIKSEIEKIEARWDTSITISDEEFENIKNIEGIIYLSIYLSN
jgi:hypothetical protein